MFFVFFGSIIEFLLFTTNRLLQYSPIFIMPKSDAHSTLPKAIIVILIFFLGYQVSSLNKDINESEGIRKTKRTTKSLTFPRGLSEKSSSPSGPPSASEKDTPNPQWLRNDNAVSKSVPGITGAETIPGGTGAETVPGGTGPYVSAEQLLKGACSLSAAFLALFFWCAVTSQ